MLPFLERLRKKLFRPVPRQKPTRPPRFTRLTLEILEDRTVLDAMLFIGAGTIAAPANWFAAANWRNLTNPANPHVPDATDDVGIPGQAGVVGIGGGQTTEINSIVTGVGSTVEVFGGSPQPSELKIDGNAPAILPPEFPADPLANTDFFDGSVIDAGRIIANTTNALNPPNVVFAGGAVIGPGDLNGNLDAGPNSSFTFTSTGEFAVGATLGPGTGSIIVAATVQVDGNLADNTETLSLVPGGTLSEPAGGGGSLTENATLGWTGGTLAVPTTIDSSGQVLASGAANKFLLASLTNMSVASRLDGGGTLFLSIPGGATVGSITIAAGDLELSLPSIASGLPGSSLTNTALGTLNVTSPASGPTTISIPFTNEGNLDVASGDKLVLSNTAAGASPDVLDGVFQLLGNLQLLGGFTSVHGFQLQADPGFLEVGSPGGGGSSAVLTVPTGVIDTIDGNLEVNSFSTLTGGGQVTNAGRLQLDLSSSTAGLGSYVQTSIGTLALAVGGGMGAPAALTVTNSASLSGTLLLLGYTPTLGKSFKVVTAGSVSGHFDAIPDGMSETDGPGTVTVTQVRMPA